MLAAFEPAARLEPVLRDRYVVIRQIKAGRVANIFKARSLADGNTVAIKQLRDEWMSEPSALRGLIDEARISQQLRHPNIARGLDLGLLDGNLAFISEFVSGAELNDFRQHVLEKKSE